MNKTKIPNWDVTINPIIGCSPAGPECLHCYAARTAVGLGTNPKTRQYEGLTTRQDKLGQWLPAPQWTGETRLISGCFDKLRTTRTPKTVFVCSMSDWLHPTVPSHWIESVLKEAASIKKHEFFFLTKRPDQIVKRGLLSQFMLLENAWFGVSVGIQESIDRLRILNTFPFMNKFISFEPLIGPVSISVDQLEDLRWIIIGTETVGKFGTARPCRQQWIQDLVTPARSAGVPIFVKHPEQYPRNLQITEYPLLPRRFRPVKQSRLL